MTGGEIPQSFPFALLTETLAMDGQQHDIILATGKRVACDGGSAGHPRVWLSLDATTQQVVCPYCSRLYASKAAAVWDTAQPAEAEAGESAEANESANGRESPTESLGENHA